jgi:flagellar motor switch protein FliG
MSKFEKELVRRLANAEDVQETAMWFIKNAIEANLDNKDLSPFEARFMKRIDEAYARWKANRRVH